ncbi:MAG: DNA methylase [Alphaproteobacteria bacterium]|nr:DNA methylase [Alphaproteobacteria bacterium]
MTTDIATFLEAQSDTACATSLPFTATPRNTILHGDCLDILPGLPAQSVDFVLTDPPYVSRYCDRKGRTIPNDRFKWLRPGFADLHRVLKPDSFCVCFYGWAHIDKFAAAWNAAGFRPVGHLAFPKRYTSATRFLRYQHEGAYLLAKGDPPEPRHPFGDVIEWTDYTGNRLHPSQKPITMLLPLIDNFSTPGGLVLDPFAGSGSSLLAAKMLGRAWLGIELDADYQAVANRRLGETQAVPGELQVMVQEIAP